MALHYVARIGITLKVCDWVELEKNSFNTEVDRTQSQGCWKSGKISNIDISSRGTYRTLSNICEGAFFPS